MGTDDKRVGATTIRQALFALSMGGHFSLRETERGILITWPGASDGSAPILVDPESGEWCDTYAGRIGQGYYSLCRHLKIDLDVTFLPLT